MFWKKSTYRPAPPSPPPAKKSFGQEAWQTVRKAIWGEPKSKVGGKGSTLRVVVPPDAETAATVVSPPLRKAEAEVAVPAGSSTAQEPADLIFVPFAEPVTPAAAVSRTPIVTQPRYGEIHRILQEFKDNENDVYAHLSELFKQKNVKPVEKRDSTIDAGDIAHFRAFEIEPTAVATPAKSAEEKDAETSKTKATELKQVRIDKVANLKIMTELGSEQKNQDGKDPLMVCVDRKTWFKVATLLMDHHIKYSAAYNYALTNDPLKISASPYPAATPTGSDSSFDFAAIGSTGAGSPRHARAPTYGISQLTQPDMSFHSWVEFFESRQLYEQGSLDTPGPSRKGSLIDAPPGSALYTPRKSVPAAPVPEGAAAHLPGSAGATSSAPPAPSV